MPQNRKLAAILFADIVGYTALMQTNEQQALASLQKFKTELESQVLTHQGKIANFYGDGCLVVFNNSVDAVKCAESLQAAFQSEPKVPVRIGLHAGDVVFRDDNVFGDAVNIASRVESMGISGAILLSSNVRNQIKNKPEFKLVSLGRFEFKNVVEGMTVYALGNEGLAVPKQGEIKGKLKEVAKAKPKRHWIWLLPFLLIVGIFGLHRWSNKVNTNKFQAEILKERIAVIPFENNTNNPELNNLGLIAADWLNKGFMDMETAEVVSNFTIRTHRNTIGILENDPQGRPSFAKLTGAQNLITGSYYQEKEEVVFKLEVVDALHGKLRFSFEPIRGQVGQKEIFLTQLRENVIGYWVAKELVDAKKINAPKYEAYELYLEMIQRLGSEKTNLKVIALDSTFYLPRIHFLNVNRGETLGKNKPHFDFLDRHFDNLSDYEKGWVNYLKNMYLGKPLDSFNSLNTIRKKYPKDFMLNNETAAVAREGLNNPILALEIYDELPLNDLTAEEIGIYYNYRMGNTVIALIHLNRLKETNEFVANFQPNKDIDNHTYISTRLFEAIANKNEERITELYLELKNSRSVSIFHFFWSAFKLEQSNLISDIFRNQLVTDIKTIHSELPPNDINRFLWSNTFARLNKDTNTIQFANLRLPKPFQISNLQNAGQLYLEFSNTSSIPFILNELQKLTKPDLSVPSQHGCAAAYYRIGQIYTQMGDYDKALFNLKKARDFGALTNLNYFQYDRLLEPLYDMPEFQELLKPIWPEIND